MTNEQIKWMIEGVKLVYANRGFWQDKAREDLLNAVFPDGPIDNALNRLLYEKWEKSQTPDIKQISRKPPEGIITVTCRNCGHMTPRSSAIDFWKLDNDGHYRCPRC